MKNILFLSFLIFGTLKVKAQKQFSGEPYSVDFSVFYSLYSSGIGIGQNEINQFLYGEKMRNGHGVGLSLLYSYYVKKLVFSGGIDVSLTTFFNSELPQITPHPKYGFILTNLQRENTSLLYAIPKIQIGFCQVIKGNKWKSKFLLRETIGVVFPLNAHHSIRYIDINSNEQTNDSEWFSGDGKWNLGLGYSAGLHLSKSQRINKKTKGYGVGLNINYFPHLNESDYELMAMFSLSVLL
ncbi:MAG: hypothetical protein JJU02_02775 [Cryomorphaceae bacterium]|nr:hypothetical protein [Cryomorphaceae bacterium]